MNRHIDHDLSDETVSPGTDTRARRALILLAVVGSSIVLYAGIMLVS